jgi:hypothetical protein
MIIISFFLNKVYTIVKKVSIIIMIIIRTNNSLSIEDNTVSYKLVTMQIYVEVYFLKRIKLL